MNIESALLDIIVNNSEDSIIVCHPGYSVLEMNPAFQRLTGFDQAASVGRFLFKFNQDEDHRDPLIELVGPIKNIDEPWTSQVRIRHKRGEAILSEASSFPIYNEEGRLTRYVVIVRNRSLQDHRVSRYPMNAYLDPLTNLPNPNMLNDRIDQALISAKREKKCVALLTLGLDRFTLINDGLGFDFGDLVLKEVADLFKRTIRQTDTIARLGGDRFCLVMVITVTDDSVIVAEKILKALNTPRMIEGRDVFITASIGITISPTDGEDSPTLLKRSESAMLYVKKLGGNNYQFFDNKMNEKAKQRIDIENNLRYALDNEEFVLYYQPKVDIESSAIVGAEALVRWNRPGEGMISPGKFIPIAEECGLIVPIGEWVLRNTCLQIRKWLDQGLNPVRISINVTSPQLHSKDIIDQVNHILEETEILPHLLEMEITESMLMIDPIKVAEILTIFRNMGIHIAIDDFGTGYSSLGYLSRFPITTLKIDRSFICDLNDNPNNAEITRAIIGLSHNLKLNLVAEGVEVAEHIKFLHEQGCATVQGFFYSRPLPADQFGDLLKIGFISKS